MGKPLRTCQSACGRTISAAMAGASRIRRVRERRRKPVEPDVAAGERVRKPGDECDQGRLIDVAPRQPPAAGEKVHLVPKPAVISATCEMQPEGAEGQQPGDAGVVRPL